MRKCFCDGCGSEVARPIKFSVPCHLWSLRGKCGYIDHGGNAISGRTDELDLCAKCANVAYSAAVSSLTPNV